MSTFKRITPSDIYQEKIVANKQWSFTLSNYSSSDGYIQVYKGINDPTFDSGSNITNNTYEKLEYDSINQLFYRRYTNTLNTQSLASSLNYESASIYRPTGSYFIYNENPAFIPTFPIEIGDTIKTTYVDSQIFGNKILPGTLVISSSDYYILDDGKGNLRDYKWALSGSGFLYVSASYVDIDYIYQLENDLSVIGNVFYSFGLFTIGNQYFTNLYPIPSTGSILISFKNEQNIYENYIQCKLSVGEFNTSYNPSLQISGSGGVLSGFATGSISGSLFTPYITTVGLYNDNNELLMVSKMGQVIPISQTTDTTIIIKYDT